MPGELIKMCISIRWLELYVALTALGPSNTPVKRSNDARCCTYYRDNVVFDYIISAFQKALSCMAFQIDGDKMGEMVVNKVERVVFA